MDYGETEYNLVVTQAYEDRRFALGQMIENAYQAMIEEDDKTLEFTCNDEEMETRAVADILN